MALVISMRRDGALYRVPSVLGHVSGTNKQTCKVNGEGWPTRPRPRTCSPRAEARRIAANITKLPGLTALPYSITLSARTNKASGTVTPIALAVLRLITSSNFVGCSTGISAILVPRNSWASCRA
jgi:hypothetical protein